MFFRQIKAIVRTVVAVGLALVILAFAQGLGTTRFSDLEGKRSYYLRSSSSQAEIKTELSPLDFFSLTGESVTFACDNEQIADELLTRYNGTLLWVEEGEGVRSYYAYAPKFQKGIRIGGRLVNLHIAVGQGRCSVGTPIIFGGF